ncbi:MAG: FHA domain-containing protein [Thermoanaerobaculia bacterium]
MQVVLQGSLRQFPAAELLTFLCHHGRSGTLDLEAVGRKTRIVFEADTIVRAESNRFDDPSEAVLDAFEWMAGAFTLLDAAVIPENAKRESMALQTLLDASAKRAEASSLYPDGTLFRLVDDPVMQQQVSLTGEEFKLLFRLSAPRTFRDLAMDVGLSRAELAERLKKLEKLGLIVSVREEPQPEPTAPQKKLTSTRKRTLVGSLTPDDRPDSVYPLLDAECTIGRSEDNGIAVPDGSVSSKHARIVRGEDGFVIEDLQSRNGTFVNGERVVEGQRKLSDGDLIRVGKVIMTFNVARETKAGDTTQPEVRMSS